MGKIKQGVLGGFSGKVGPVIGTSWKGKAVMKARALSYNDRQSQAQLEQRMKFGLISKFVCSMAGFINEGFNNRAVEMTELNAAVAANINDAITGTYPNYEVDYTLCLVSNGNIDLPYSPSATADGTSLSLTWSDNSGMGNAETDDKVMVVAFNPTKNQSVYSTNLAERNERSATFTLPTAWTGDTVNVWMAMKREKNGETSKSVHLASLTL